MLDAETKSRIDSARDILVGKVPDPKSQVEQITIALIYKFMDDMDRQSEELGGKPSFFKGEFKKYRWTDLLDKRLGGHERLLLYAEGIERMNENKNIPQLFRDIFKGVFLPYRDPETLNLFLKEINGFTYDHSERLGDAYEHLLNILGTQGEAGQFRTPRHIIDFIVAVVDPQKHETVLDPACGTAGFLISAYKHILAAHNPSDRSDPRKSLTPDERARLMTNFCGYDIAPDMVRLSRVNLYLHGFPNPTIHEYDTLTSEERWDERSDVIMANPPFMTPKGGIRPHKRFAISANRSEVLFVDYIAEHLNPSGRAGVIVPEGIIFQSQNAYKNLRRMLAENYLWAVVSLPAGVFNPYSGVKTSILLLDRNLAKRAESVLFVKIENDGFDLGAQRRPIEQNDLPEALKALLAWKSRGGANVLASRTGHAEKRLAGTLAPPAELRPEIAHAVSRKKILESPDVSLSGDRYRAVEVRGNGKWPMVKLAEVTEVNRASCEPEKIYGKKSFVYLDISSVDGETHTISYSNRVIGHEAPSRAKRVVQRGDVLLSTVRPNLQAFVYLENPPTDAVASTGFAVLTPDRAKILGRFLHHLLFAEPVMRQMIGRMGKGAYPSITQKDVEEIEIPLPPLAEQERLVAELERLRRVIESARQILASYKPTLRINPDWPMKKISEVCKVESGFGFPLGEQGKTDEKIPFLKVSDMNLEGNERFITCWNNSVSESVLHKLKGEAFPKGTVIFPKIGAAVATNKKRILTIPSTFDNNVMGLIPGKELDSVFLHSWLLSFNLSDWASKSMPPSIRKTTVEETVIPVPPLTEQRALVAELEAERKLVEANRELAVRFEQKLQSKLAEIWGEEGGACR